MFLPDNKESETRSQKGLFVKVTRQATVRTETRTHWIFSSLLQKLDLISKLNRGKENDFPSS